MLQQVMTVPGVIEFREEGTPKTQKGQIEAIVFDLDHTLYDRYSTLRGIAYLFKRRFVDKLDPTISAAMLGDMFVSADKNCIYHGWKDVFKYLNKQGIFTEQIDYQEYFEFMREGLTKVAVPIPSVANMLLELKKQNLKVALITNGSKKIQLRKLEMLDLGNAFEQIITTKDFGADKPKPEPFLEMARLLGCNPNRMIYVGDHPYNDVAGAHGAGYVSVWVNTAGKEWVYSDIERADYEINDVLELPGIIEGLY